MTVLEMLKARDDLIETAFAYKKKNKAVYDACMAMVKVIDALINKEVKL